MDSKTGFGIGVFALGIALLLYTFYMAYGIYSYVASGQVLSSTHTQQTNSTNTNIAGSLVGSFMAAVPLNQYAIIFLEVIIILAFASISYKIAKLGIELINSGKQTDAHGKKS